MATTLLTVLSFMIIAATGVGLAGRLRDTRKPRHEQDTVSPDVTISPTLVASSTPSPTAIPAVNQPTQSLSLPKSPEPEIATPANWQTQAPLIPDPWDDDPIPPVELATSTLEPAEEIVQPTTTELTLTSGIATLGNRIAQAGRSRQLRQAAALLRYTNHADAQIRATTATALGNIAANKQGFEVEAIVRVLGKLSQDPKPEVRLQAVEGLATIRSASVLPWLQQALRQSDSRVRRAATIAIQRLKVGYPAKPAIVVRQQKRPLKK